MDVCAVVVWFNPEKLTDAAANISSYASALKKIYIVDNSSENNVHLAAQIKNSLYIPLGKNTGIANALNVGCECAIADGFHWCMTMDQDSVWNDMELKKYMATIDAQNSFFQNFSPSLKYESLYSFSMNIKNIFRNRRQTECVDFQFDDRWITSGSVMKLSVWSDLGKFNPELFIDEVDFDYCARFSEAGMKNLCCKDVVLHHTLGESKKFFFLNYGSHSNFRVYYQIRNLLYMKNTYPEYTRKYKGKYDLIKKMTKLVFLNPFKTFSYIKLLKKAARDSIVMCAKGQEHL